jgi:hypothetical protein
LTLFEKIQLDELLTLSVQGSKQPILSNQLNLLD